ncbi:AraC family transcriptional regulator [Paenibacillus sp. BC26]|uniref:AraC family transcriptional regulator n=1 Tax=Paenibacillus sp. BC26 TaxID=1881032 RepID=UPI0008ECEA00|nr:helix-turn-helix domain-containing protein [Paenibacillus sp. BC26]SFS57437.1 Helix-turn-helix domain-containing protein [Paenibacillus sp. BC26]
MRQILQLKINTRSILTKMVLSFMAIILLFVSFNLISLTLFRKSIHGEIITYNDANLSHTTSGFEQYFALLDNVIVGMYLNDHLNDLQKSKPYYMAAGNIIDDLEQITVNPRIYLNNLFMYDVKHHYILDKYRGSSLDVMFTEHYVNGTYTPAFWEKELSTAGSASKLYPAAVFKSPPPTYQDSQPGVVIPYLFRSQLYPDFKFLAFIDADQLYRNYHQSINNTFYILSPQGDTIYTSDPAFHEALPELKPGRNWVKQNGYYFFYQKGTTSELTYVNIIPDSSVSSKIVKLTVTLIVLLVVTSIVSLVLSVIFSRRFNNPVRKIVESIRSLNENKELVRGAANDFELIHANIGHMIKVNQEAQRSLESRKNHLRHYSLMNVLKRIRIEYEDSDPAAEQDYRPFRFILFQMNFKQRFWDEMPEEEERTIAFIREYMIQAIGREMEGAQTFQIETNQILSVIYMNDEDDNRLSAVLSDIKTVLETDNAYSFCTIAVSSSYPHSSQMTSAYAEVLKLVKLRPFDDTTYVSQAGETNEKPMLTTSILEQELNVSLQEGNDLLALQSLRRMLAKMKKRNIPAIKFHRFAEETTDKVMRVLHSMQIDTDELSCMLPSIEKQHTIEELDCYLEKLVSEAGRLVRLKKEERDPIISFTVSYTESHYGEELSLDLIAGKLNISGGYLSTYFKEKMGTNFVDFVNEVRVKKAKDLLLLSEMKIQEIATSVGYTTLSSFNRSFKKISGVTPTEFRRNAAVGER